MIKSDLRISVLSRRAPIRFGSGLAPSVEHVGGLTRVLPALAEFAHINWFAFASDGQGSIPGNYSYSEIAHQVLRNEINISLVKVNDESLNLGDWLCATILWPLLHDLEIPKIGAAKLDSSLAAIAESSSALAHASVESEASGFFVNDFQLSQVPLALRASGKREPITFFLHTPWPKTMPSNPTTLKLLKFLATGMLAANVIEFQTKHDLLGFQEFTARYFSLEATGALLRVNPVSVDYSRLQNLAQVKDLVTSLERNDISFVHIARSDPVKNTAAVIDAFTQVFQARIQSGYRIYLDLFIVPSRQQWPEYQHLFNEILRQVEVANEELSIHQKDAIRLRIGNDHQNAVRALTRYDYLLVCSVADGLNLVVKEGAILNQRNGVIISTPKVGAMAELGDFCVIARDSSEANIVAAIKCAMNLDPAIRVSMSQKLRNQVKEYDLSHWARSVVANFEPKGQA